MRPLSSLELNNNILIRTLVVENNGTGRFDAVTVPELRLANPLRVNGGKANHVPWPPLLSLASGTIWAISHCTIARSLLSI